MSQFDRRSTILGDLDVRALKGLELGPLTNPVVRKTDGVVFYIDHLDAESLKKANRNPQIINDDMVNIDIIWGERPLKELVPHPMDYAVASHVMEHVPDFIGSLMDLHGALKEDGLICLAIPDRRFTHDLRRPESTVGEMVEAYLLRVRRPPARHLFDRVLLQAPRHWKCGVEGPGVGRRHVCRIASANGVSSRRLSPCRAGRLDHRLRGRPLLDLHAGVVPGCCRPLVADRPFPLCDRVLSPHRIRRLRVLHQAPQVARSRGDHGLDPGGSADSSASRRRNRPTGKC